MEITVTHYERTGKKEVVYNLEFISNYTFNEFNKLNSEIIRILTLQQKAQAIAEKHGEMKAKGTGDIEALQKELEDNIKESLNGEKNFKNLIQWQWDIVKELLESNGYEFDQKYWEKTTQKDECRQILDKVFGANGEVKKKLMALK